MKHLLLKMLPVFLLGLLGTDAFAAYDFQVDELYYEIISAEDRTVKVVSPYPWDNNSQYVSGALVIPDRVKHDDVVYTVKEIRSYAFTSCSIFSVKIPETIVTIGEWAFKGSLLTSVTIPNSVKTLEKECFYNCTRLGYVEFGNSLETIGSGAFKGCSNLTSIEIPEGVTTIGSSAFSDCINLDEAKLPNSVTSIWSNAFWCCRNLTSVNLPDGLTVLEKGVFSGCTSLTSLVLPSSLTSIGGHAMSSCPITDIMIPDGVKRIEYNAFAACKKLTKVNIPASVTFIGNWAFNGCEVLAELTFSDSSDPEGLSIDYGAFGGCKKLLSVYLPNSVKSIERGVFSGCSSLKEVRLPDGLTTLSKQLFLDCAIEEIKLPDGLTSISESAFSGCPLTKITFPESLVSIGDSAFPHSKFKTVILPESVLYLGTTPFSTNVSVIFCKSAVPPSAGLDTFADAMYTETIICVPVGGKSVYEKTVPWRDFAHIEETDFVDAESIEPLFEVDGIQYKLTSVSGKTVNVNKGVTSSDGGVSGDIVIPEKVENNGITYDVTAIAANAFYRNSSVLTVDIPASISEIGKNAFWCPNLKTVALRGSDTYLNENAFYGGSIEDVYCYGESAPVGESNVFAANIYTTATLHVPVGKKEEYAAVTPWSQFGKVEEIGALASENINDDDAVTISTFGGAIVISGYDGIVSVYNLNGSEVYSGTERVIDGLSKGVYIVRTAGLAAKITL